MQELEIVSMIKVNGVWVRQEEIPREELCKLLEKKLDQAMKGIGFERVKNCRKCGAAADPPLR